MASDFLSPSPSSDSTTTLVNTVSPSFTIISPTNQSTAIAIAVIFFFTLIIGIFAILCTISIFHRHKSRTFIRNNTESDNNNDLDDNGSNNLNTDDDRSVATREISLDIIEENRMGFLHTPTTQELEEENIITPNREHFIVNRPEFLPERSRRPFRGRGRFQRGLTVDFPLAQPDYFGLDFGGIGPDGTRGEASNRRRRESEGVLRFEMREFRTNRSDHKRYSL
ncbi:18146_t:CDS:1 [Acaulospora morrowiae]|uniref:18146_t:CDS:1 n=1 Tax=Acaulospora morrowiae TaxID=94023 RepID=A0A9N9E646_9GLOM|nr:18146_t:CDS:1 [Acaulospora morrowiae]